MASPTMHALMPYFADEPACITFLYSKEVFYLNFDCPACGTSMTLKQHEARFCCTKGNCRMTTSFRIGTFFHGSNLPCSKILFMAYLWLQGVSSNAMIQMTGHSAGTICNFKWHFQQLASSDLQDESMVIGGKDIVVELDESKIGKRKYNRGHRVDGIWVVGGIERISERRVFVVPVENRNKVTLNAIIQAHVNMGSIVHTDLWKGYNGLSKLGYIHKTVKHSISFKDYETGTHINTIEGLWNGIKCKLPSSCRTKKNIDGKICEFIWRRQNKNRLWDSFILALKNIHYEK